jgi:internalin A
LLTLKLDDNALTTLPEWLGEFDSLQELNLSSNQLMDLPDRLCDLKRLQELNLSRNELKTLPGALGQIGELQSLDLSSNQLTVLPESVGKLTRLRTLLLRGNPFKTLPESLGQLTYLRELNIDVTALDPELAAASEQGLLVLLNYLRAEAEGKVALNEAKLILIGEGEVGKSCLLEALRGDQWIEGRPTTHGIEIKSIKVTNPKTGTEITLNGWDFGGQPVYRPTHQLFFSSPAVYLVVWKPREGPQQGFVKEWIKLVKHREPDAKILVVATHGGPGQRQPDIDRQEIWDSFGRDTVVDFFLVDNKPDTKNERRGIAKLKTAIAMVAAELPEMGRKVPTRWQKARDLLQATGSAYLPLEQVLRICRECQMEDWEAPLFLTISHRLGHLIHYGHDPALRDIVVLKPDWLATAISLVLDDEQTRKAHGLVSFARLGALWRDPDRSIELHYEPRLHPVFLRLMERFDLSYKVALVSDTADEIGFWQKIGHVFSKISKPTEEYFPLHYTSLIAQLVPDIRPEDDLSHVWQTKMPSGDEQQLQICRIVDKKSGQSALAEGLFYQLIVRLHKFSLGRINYDDSVHWQRGLVLDDDYNGRALLEHIGNDVRITVRAPYPERFLSVLTSEVKWLVENFWAGLRCDVMVPCVEPCGKKAPGTGLFEVQKLIESKRRSRPEYPCPVCNEWQSIDLLLRNAPAARPISTQELLTIFAGIKEDMSGVRQQLMSQHHEALRRFDQLDTSTQRTLSKLDDAFTGLMQALTDEAKEGPRLFSLKPVDPGFLDRPKWISTKFELTLWCERSRLPLPSLNAKGDRRGVYELSLPHEWFVKAAPFLKVLTATLTLALPVASAATKFVLDDASYKHIEKELDLGQKSIETVIKGGEGAGGWLGHRDAPELEQGEAVRAQGAILRQLHAWLKEKDPSFGGLVRVQNKRQEFLWIHPKFEEEY